MVIFIEEMLLILSNCCGICLYGKNHEKYDSTKNECMIKGYEVHDLSHVCSSFKRDYQKQISVKSIKKVSVNR